MKKLGIFLLIFCSIALLIGCDNQKNFSNITFENETVIYNGDNHIPTISGVDSKALVEYSINEIIDAGVYEVTATISLKGYNTLELTKVVTVQKANYSNDVITLENNKQDYNDSDVILEFNNPLLLEYDYIILLNDEEVSAIKEVGVYQIVITVESSKNYNEKEIILDFEVEEIRLENPLIYVLFEDETFIYDGLEHTPLIENILPEMEVEYNLDTVKDAGVYNITAIVTFEGQQIELTKTITIEKAALDETAITISELTYAYTGEEILLDLRIIDELDFNILITKNSAETIVKEAGEYVITVMISESTNYLEYSFSFIITVEKAELSSTAVKINKLTYTYTGEEILLDIIVLEHLESSVIITKDSEEAIIKEVGVYTVNVIVLESTNYLAKAFIFTITVKEEIILSHPFISEYLEGGYDKDYFPSGNNNDKALEFYNPTSEDISWDGYKIVIRSDKNEYIINLVGMIGSHSTFIIVNQYSQKALLDIADQTAGLYFSGIHVVALYYEDTLIDIIGDFSETYVASEGGMIINGFYSAATDGRLMRKPQCSANPVFTENEWIVITDQEFNDLGFHIYSFDDAIIDIKYITLWLMVEFDCKVFSENLNLPTEFEDRLLEWESYSEDVVLADGTIFSTGVLQEGWLGVWILDLDMEFYYVFITIYVL